MRTLESIHGMCTQNELVSSLSHVWSITDGFTKKCSGIVGKLTNNVAENFHYKFELELNVKSQCVTKICYLLG